MAAKSSKNGTTFIPSYPHLRQDVNFLILVPKLGILKCLFWPLHLVATQGTAYCGYVLIPDRPKLVSAVSQKDICNLKPLQKKVSWSEESRALRIAALIVALFNNKVLQKKTPKQTKKWSVPLKMYKTAFWNKQLCKRLCKSGCQKCFLQYSKCAKLPVSLIWEGKKLD